MASNQLSLADLNTPEFKAIEDRMNAQDAGNKAANVAFTQSANKDVTDFLKWVDDQEKDQKARAAFKKAGINIDTLNAALEGLKENWQGLKRVGHTITGQQNAANADAATLAAMQQKFEDDPNMGTEQKMARLMAKYAPYLVGGPEIEGLKMGVPALDYLIKYGPTGLAMGAINANPDESLTKAALTAAGINLALPGAGAGVSAATRKFIVPLMKKAHALLSNKAFIKSLAETSPRSATEVDQLVQQNKGQNLVGKALDIPYVTKLETNILPDSVIGTKSAADKLRNISQSLIDQAGDIYGQLTLGLDKSAVGKKIQDILNKYLKFVEKNVDDFYGVRNKLGDEQGFEVDPTETKKAIERAIVKYSGGKREGGISAFKKEIDILKEMYNTISDRSEKGLGMTLSGASEVRSNLREYAENAKTRGKSGLFNSVKAALNKDIENAIDKTGSSDLKLAHKIADNYYATVYVPFAKNKKLMSALNAHDTDLITQTFLPKTDRPTVLEHILQSASPDGKLQKLLLTDFFREGVLKNELGKPFVDPTKMFGLLNDLGDERISMLTTGNKEINKNVSDDINQFLNNYRLNREALLRAYNPKTGQMNLSADILSKLVDEVSQFVDKDISKKTNSLVKAGTALTAAMNVAKTLADPEVLAKVAEAKRKLEALKAKAEKNPSKKSNTAPLRRLAVIAGS